MKTTRDKGEIYWIYGEGGSGKSWLAEKLVADGSIWLDGDDMRATISADLGFSDEDRLENNLRIARLAEELAGQGFGVVVSTQAPTEKIREQIYYACKCRFVSIGGAF